MTQQLSKEYEVQLRIFNENSFNQESGAIYEFELLLHLAITIIYIYIYLLCFQCVLTIK